MIEHVSIPVKNFKKAKEFYTKILATVGYKVNMEFEGAAGFMADGHTSFWIVERPHNEKMHVAFLSHNRDEVGAFHAAGLQAGGTDNGQPGLRPDYSPDYYASFILDPEGNNLEAVAFSE